MSDSYRRRWLPGVFFVLCAFTHANGQTNPEPFDLSTGIYSFTSWPASSPAGTYPPNMVFHRGPRQDPALDAEPNADYTLAYNLTSGTRIIGHDEDGFSFQNTASPGNLGAAVLALNTTGRGHVTVTWRARTFQTGANPYAIQLQFRVFGGGGWSGWTNVPGHRYVDNIVNHTQTFGPTELPAEVDDQAEVQLRWKYHALGGWTTRPRLGIEEISVASVEVGKPVITVTGANLSAFRTRAGTPSAVQTYAVEAYGVGEEVTVSAPPGFELKLGTEAVAEYRTTITLQPAEGVLASTQINVRLSGESAGTFVGAIKNESEGANNPEVPVTGIVFDEYQWIPSGSAAWTDSTSWAPSRQYPTRHDILRFNGGDTLTVTAVPAETVGRILVESNTHVILLSAADGNVLDLTERSGAALSVEAGSHLEITGPDALEVRLGQDVRATIFGNVTLVGAPHRLYATNTGENTRHLLAFYDGATFTQGKGVSGHVFGYTADREKTVAFMDGSTMVQYAGSNPFGGAFRTVVVFWGGSTFVMKHNAPLSLSERQYGRIEIDAPDFYQTDMTGGSVWISDLTIRNAQAVHINLHVYLSGNITVHSGVLAFDPSSPRFIRINWNTIVSGEGSVRFGPDGNIDLNGGLTLETPVEVLSTIRLFRGTLMTNGNLVLKSDDAGRARMGRIAYGGDGSIVGDVTIERLLTGTEGWRMISSPIEVPFAGGDEALLSSIRTQGAAGADTAGGEPNVLRYDETIAGNRDEGLVPVENLTASLTRGEGYFVYVFEDENPNDSLGGGTWPKTLSVTGPVDDSETIWGRMQSLPVTYTHHEGFENGWNIVSNPFVSPIYWNIEEAWIKDNIDATIYIWDPNRDGEADYVTITKHHADMDSTIAPFQAFWVKASGPESELAVAPRAKRVPDMFIGKQPEPEIATLSMKLSTGNRHVPNRITFREDGSIGPDPYDAYRLTPPTNAFLNLYTLRDDGAPLVINNLPLVLAENLEIPLHAAGVEQGMPMAGTYSLSWSRNEALPPEWQFVLVDHENGTEVDMAESGEYVFEIMPTSGKTKMVTAPNHPGFSHVMEADEAGTRFTLRALPVATGIDDPRAWVPSAFALHAAYPNPFNPSTQIVYDVPEHTFVRVSVYDGVGRRVAVLAEHDHSPGEHRVSWNAAGMASGLYFVRMEGADRNATRSVTLLR